VGKNFRQPGTRKISGELGMTGKNAERRMERGENIHGSAGIHVTIPGNS
jgi:hypothetical protein